MFTIFRFQSTQQPPTEQKKTISTWSIAGFPAGPTSFRLTTVFLLIGSVERLPLQPCSSCCNYLFKRTVCATWKYFAFFNPPFYWQKQFDNFILQLIDTSLDLRCKRPFHGWLCSNDTCGACAENHQFTKHQTKIDAVSIPFVLFLSWLCVKRPSGTKKRGSSTCVVNQVQPKERFCCFFWEDCVGHLQKWSRGCVGKWLLFGDSQFCEGIIQACFYYNSSEEGFPLEKYW